MLKKISFILLIAFVVSFGFLYYFHYQQQQNLKKIVKLEEMKSKLEAEKLIKSQKVEPSTGDMENKEKILEKLVARQLVDISDLQKSNPKSPYNLIYKKLYLNAMKKNNLVMAEKAVKRLLPYTKEKDVWLKILVDLDLQLGKFTDAKKYSEELIKVKPTKDNFKKYLYVKIQTTNFFDDNQVESLKQLVKLLYQKQVISPDELSFYDFLINLLSKWNYDTSYEELNMLLKDIKNSQIKNLLLSFKKDFEVYKSYKGSPDYYLKALIALDLLKFGYFGLAKNIAQQVYIQDPYYILPLQILAYAYFYMGNYKKSLEYFKKLDQQDPNGNEYKFFIGISYYWLGDYERALLFLAQISSKSPYYVDALRYKLLSYIHLEDTSNVIKTIKELSKYKLTYVDYYNIFKYLLFTCRDCYKDNLNLIINLAKSCYKDVNKNYEYVCWYGKGNLFLKYGKINIAVRYFKVLSNYFQDTYIWDTLAKYYETKKNYKLARYYYLKELLYTSNETKRQQLKQKIKDLFLKQK